MLQVMDYRLIDYPTRVKDLPEVVEMMDLREVLQEVGEAIADARNDRDWNQRELGELCGVEYGTVGRWENGSSFPWGVTFRKLRRALPEIAAVLEKGATAAEKLRIASRTERKGGKRPPTPSDADAKEKRRAAAAARAATKAKVNPKLKDRQAGGG